MEMLSRWNPMRSVSNFNFDRMTDLEELFRDFHTRSLSRSYEKKLEMRTDVHEDDKVYRVTVDIPGVPKDNIDVAIEGNQVMITVEVKREMSHDNETEVHRERFSGKACRSFTLPTEVDSSKSEARYDGGVLSLKLPKKSNGQSRHLSIN